MRPTKTRFVTVCQQALVVGTALAVLGPAADVISLDVVTRPGAAAQLGDPQAPAPQAPATGGAAPEATVETAPVDPKVTEVPVDEAADVSAEEAAEVGDEPVPTDGEVVETAPQKVEGYGAIGVTWETGTEIEEGQIAVQARTRVDGEWSEWSELHYNAEEGPDPDSADARNARPGTDPLIIGDVDEVQTRVVTARGVDAPDLEMAVVDPGRSVGTKVEEPAISTGGASTVAEDATLSTDQGEIALQAGTTVARPTIYSRAQWGADESWRRGSVDYGTIAAGFIHHTVNANDYTAEQVPGMLRSIYAYHTKTKGWNDIGYNFVIDRFGRIWEGRYGGVDKAVVGAHTAGYNSYSFAASALGNFEEVQPSSAMLDAYARLYAWKLSLYGIAADDTSQRVGSGTFQAINGHRDAGSTACPGRYLYAKIPDVRVATKRYQTSGVTSPSPTPTPTPTTTTSPKPTAANGTPRVPDLVGSSFPDLVARRSSDGAAVVLPTGGLLSFGSAVTKSTGWARFDTRVISPDLNSDGISDMFVRNASTGTAAVRPGRGDGTFGKAITPTKLFVGYDLITPAGRFDRGWARDLIGRNATTGTLVLFKGDGKGSFSKIAIGSGFQGYNKLIATGDITGDGHGDVLARTSTGRLYRFNGDGEGRVGAGTRIAGTWNHPVVTGFGDLTGDRLPDLLVRKSDGATYVAQGTGNGAFSMMIPASGSLSGLSSVTAAPVLGSAEPDAVGFSGDSMVVVPHTGRINVGKAIHAGVSFRSANAVLNAGDWDRDGHGDVLTRQTNGDLVFYRGLGTGKLAAGKVIDTRDWNVVSMLTAAGDVTGDKKPDLVANKNGELVVFAGDGVNALSRSQVLNPELSGTSLLDLGRWDAGSITIDTGILSSGTLSWLRGNLGDPRPLSADVSGLTGVVGAGDVTGDGRVDLVGRTSGGRLWVLAGTTSGFAARRYLGGGFAGYDLIS